MHLVSHSEIENMLEDLKREINYVVDRKLQYIRDQFEKELNEYEEFYKKDKLSDL